MSKMNEAHADWKTGSAIDGGSTAPAPGMATKASQRGVPAKVVLAAIIVAGVIMYGAAVVFSWLM